MTKLTLILSILLIRSKHAISLNTLEAALDTDYRVARSAFVDTVMFNSMKVNDYLLPLYKPLPSIESS